MDLMSVLVHPQLDPEVLACDPVIGYLGCNGTWVKGKQGKWVGRGSYGLDVRG
ncbi:hypothetical protein Q8W37_15025 [Shimia thalassica]|uniref:hypothetical protein n=1 Tax=Shimia thalassica TaxID=1715693 RepID=UPI0027350055|nr:hypothetical protein [Shimia thalassica]MDP2581250.1 hypothetical protein [Shimia thalassica]